jgi:hypothetical protein
MTLSSSYNIFTSFPISQRSSKSEFGAKRYDKNTEASVYM